MAKKIIGYCRVSKIEQDINSQALEQQISRVKSIRVDDVYVDVLSGRKNDRENFLRLLEEIKLGQISQVVATRLDRITRKLKTQIEFIDLLKEHNVTLKILDQDYIDTSTASGLLFCHLLGAVAQNESDQLSERINHGLDYYRSQNRPMGACLGYQMTKEKLIISTDKILCEISSKKEFSRYDLARWLIDEFLSLRATYYSTSKKYNEKFGFQSSRLTNNRSNPTPSLSPTGIKRWLLNPQLRGHLVYYPNTEKQQIIYGTHTAILTPIEWIKIQEKINFYPEKQLVKTSNYSLSGLLYCSKCDRRLTVSKQKIRKNHEIIGWKIYYRCIRSTHGKCEQKKRISADEVKTELKEFLRQKSEYLSHFDSQQKNTICPEIVELTNQIEVMQSLPKNNAIDEAIRKLEKEKNDIESNQQNIIKNQTENIDILQKIYETKGFWDCLTEDEEKEVFKALIKKIVFDGFNIDIEPRF